MKTYANRSRQKLFSSPATQEVIQSLMTDDDFLKEAVKFLVNRQTEVEMSLKTSKGNNKQGLRWSHAKMFSDMVERGITDEDISWLREATASHPDGRITMYWEQLI